MLRSQILFDKLVLLYLKLTNTTLLNQNYKTIYVFMLLKMDLWIRDINFETFLNNYVDIV